MMEIIIFLFTVGVGFVITGILYIPYRKKFARILRAQWLNILSEKTCEVLLVIYAPLNVLLGLFLIIVGIGMLPP